MAEAEFSEIDTNELLDLFVQETANFPPLDTLQLNQIIQPNPTQIADLGIAGLSGPDIGKTLAEKIKLLYDIGMGWHTVKGKVTNQTKGDRNIAARVFRHDFLTDLNNAYNYAVDAEFRDLAWNEPAFFHGVIKEAYNMGIVDARAICAFVEPENAATHARNIHVPTSQYLLQQKYHSKDVRIHYNGITPDMGVPSHLQYIMYQFAKNAFENNAETLHITYQGIGRSKKLTYIGVKVEDNGTGIETSDKESLSRIFGTYSAKGEGGGLGLQGVKRLVEMMDGFLIAATKTQAGEVQIYDMTTEDEYTGINHLPFDPEIRESIVNGRGTHFSVYVPLEFIRHIPKPILGSTGSQQLEEE